MAVAGDDLDNYILNLTQKAGRGSLGLGAFIDKLILKRGGILILRPLKLRLFNFGVDGTGKKITPPINPGYQKRKRKRGFRAAFVSLRLTGQFYQSMFVTSKQGEIVVGSGDEPGKVSDLLNKYGEDILTLTIEEQQNVIKEIEPDLEKWLNDKNINISFK